MCQIDKCFVFVQDGDEAIPVLTSSDIVKVPDPQIGMVGGHKSLNSVDYSVVFTGIKVCFFCLSFGS